MTAGIGHLFGEQHWNSPQGATRYISTVRKAKG